MSRDVLGAVVPGVAQNPAPAPFSQDIVRRLCLVARARTSMVTTGHVSTTNDLPFQLDWDVQRLRDVMEITPDFVFALARFVERTEEATALGAGGPVVELAAGDGRHACGLRARGLGAVILEPSPAMLARARVRQNTSGVHVPLVRAVAEASPFRDGAFSRTLCDSALDHLADAERAIADGEDHSPDGRACSL
jgi:hypothetical protein